MLPVSLNPRTATHGEPHTGRVATLAPGCEAGEGVPIPPAPPPFIQPNHRCIAVQTIWDKAAGEALNTIRYAWKLTWRPWPTWHPVADVAGGARTYTRIRAEGTCTRGRPAGQYSGGQGGVRILLR